MTIRFKIHEDLGLVVTRYMETVTDDDAVSFYEWLYTNPGMRPGFNELADLSDVKILNMTVEGVRRLGVVTDVFIAEHSEWYAYGDCCPKGCNFWGGSNV